MIHMNCLIFFLGNIKKRNESTEYYLLQLKWHFISRFLMSLLTFCVSGISLRFATNLFRSWLEERDMASIVKSLKTAQLDTRLLVSIEWPENTAQVNIKYGLHQEKRCL